jgi:hypothetical protein
VSRALVFLLSGGSIAALLADLYGIAPMHVVFWYVSVPSMAALVALGTIASPVREFIRVGAIGGVLGTLGYDIIRVPFALAGQRLFAPIDSYGLLIADAVGSSGYTSTLGWLYHLSNGVTFGVAYAAIAARRHWAWGILWGLGLESVAVFGPFAGRYAIAGQVVPIAIAYAAHVFYGYPLGVVVQRMPRLAPGAVAATLTAAVLAIVGWQQPWSHPGPDKPVAVVRHDRFDPEWLRIRAGQCIEIDNRATNTRSSMCFTEPGAHRVRLGPRPYSGGFVYVEK